MTDDGRRRPVKISATARVTVTVEIACDSALGGDCTVEQIDMQARDDALGKLRHALGPEGLGWRIVGSPAVVECVSKVERENS